MVVLLFATIWNPEIRLTCEGNGGKFWGQIIVRSVRKGITRAMHLYYLLPQSNLSGSVSNNTTAYSARRREKSRGLVIREVQRWASR